MKTTTSMKTPAKVVTRNFLLDIDETRNILSVIYFLGLRKSNNFIKGAFTFILVRFQAAHNFN